ncbi:hypothetical protein H8N00_23035 [Streptomyces sp. AC563]|uniref:hypothetical protein n=1 Tax=Streptomyces buecherae TaxID=2763006 RepID=UPI00164D922D|nr:hypothetical protein [Streptomyces buecherae]MBC3991703.1 hypothetical protein [Streptomyces buecherae]
MANNGAGAANESGYALLIAAGPTGKQRAMDTAAALPSLAAVAPSVLLGTAGGAQVVQLVDPDEPHTVLTHLRTAAAHPGPVLVYLVGQLTLDTKQHLPHLALARTTPKTARYTALPWHWLLSELGHRPTGTTTVFADLAADETAWPKLTAEQLTIGLALYGCVVPPPRRRQLNTPHYTRALAAALRSVGTRPPLPQLHQHAVEQSGLDQGTALLVASTGGAPHPAGGDGGLPLGVPHTTPTGPADPALGPAPTGAANAWAPPASPPPGAGLPLVPGFEPAAGPASPQPNPTPDQPQWPPVDATPTPSADPDPDPGPDPAVTAPEPAPPATPSAAPAAPATTPQSSPPVAPPAASAAPRAPEAGDAADEPTDATARPAGEARPVEPAGEGPSQRAAVPPPPRASAAHPDKPPLSASGTHSGAPHTAPADEAAPTPDRHSGQGGEDEPASVADRAAVGDAEAAPRRPYDPGPPPAYAPGYGGGEVAHDPHGAILEAAHAGRHSEAAAMAAAWEQEAFRSAGPDSPQALHWLEVRADLARLAGDPARACELWMAAATTRLSAGQAADQPDVEGAVDRAHHQWQHVNDLLRARSLATELMALRTRVPGRRPGALRAIQARLESLRSVHAS